jgi:radical SAM protein with 4Fe4S-binding SPASM domain
MLLCISPSWRLRNDRSRVIAHKYSADESKWHVLTPETGLALALFDGATTLDAISRQLQEVANFTELAARQLLTRTVGAFFTGSDPVLCEAQTLVPGSWPVYPPEDMVVPPSCFEPDKRLDAPLSLVLMPFNQCRTDCLYCYSERNPIPPRDLLSLKRWTEILREGAAAGTNIAVFSGGDPMLYPNILQLLDVLISLDYAFLVSTKSLVKASFAKALAAAGIGDRFFQISLDAWNPNLADFMAGRRGYHRTALRSIENLVPAGIRVRLNAVCTPHNYKDIPALFEGARVLGVTKATAAAYGRSMYRHDDGNFLAPGQMDWLRNEIRKIDDGYEDFEARFNGSVIDYNMENIEEKWGRWSNRSSCSGGRSSLTICADGRVLLCEQMPQQDQYTCGNLRHQGLLEVWNSPRLHELTFPGLEQFIGTPCEGCSEFDACHDRLGYCFRDALNAYGSVYQPPPNCPKAPPSPRFA